GAEAELRERGARLRPGALPARDAEAEQVGVAHREPAFGFVRFGQIERRFLALLDALDRREFDAERLGLDLALADGEQQVALAVKAESLGEPLALGLVDGDVLAFHQRKQDTFAERVRALLLGDADGTADRGARLAGRGYGLPVRGRQMVLVADDLDFIARLEL